MIHLPLPSAMMGAELTVFRSVSIELCTTSEAVPDVLALLVPVLLSGLGHANNQLISRSIVSASTGLSFSTRCRVEWEIPIEFAAFRRETLLWTLQAFKIVPIIDVLHS